jgi:GDP-D-mannose 3', 5'-epimerase
MSKGKGVRVLVTGAGGFIGHHLVSYLKKHGYWVRGVDIKKPEYAPTQADEFRLLDLRRWNSCSEATEGIEEVYALAADMGGMGFISTNHARILHNNSLISIQTLEAAREHGVKRYLYTSSACIYPIFRQMDTSVAPLKEEDAYPAMPEDAYGWEKLMTERLCEYYRNDYGIQSRVVRFHNIFGPKGAWEGGREKAPAAISRKVAYAKLTANPEVEIWGDGHQTRSFCFIDDCVEGIHKLMRSNHPHPLNLGSDRLISINDLVDLVARIAKVKVVKKHIPGPQGVRGRNSDNTRLRQVLKWEPHVSLEEGLAKTYAWIEKQVAAKLEAAGAEGKRRKR